MIIKRKKVAAKVMNDRELIETNAKSIDALVVLAGDDKDLVEQLKELKEELKYLIATEDPDVVDCDKKIKNRIGDFRDSLEKPESKHSKATDDLLTEIKLAIADRKTRL